MADNKVSQQSKANITQKKQAERPSPDLRGQNAFGER